MAVPTSFDART